jgi:hypothetical protein
MVETTMPRKGGTSPRRDSTVKIGRTRNLEGQFGFGKVAGRERGRRALGDATGAQRTISP